MFANIYTRLSVLVLIINGFAIVANGQGGTPAGPVMPSAQPSQPPPQAAPPAPKPVVQPMPNVTNTLPPGAILVNDAPKPKKKQKLLTPVTAATNTPVVTPAAAAPAPLLTMPRLTNPFEVTKSATPKTAAPVAAVADTTQKTAPVAVAAKPYFGDTLNPFELPRNDVAVTTITNTKTGKNKVTIADDGEEQISKQPFVSPFKQIFNKMDNSPSHFLLFVTLFSLLLYLAFVMTVYRDQVNKIMSAFGNGQYLVQMYREQGQRWNFHFWVIYALFVVSVGVFCYQLAKHFNAPMGGPLTGLLLCMGGVTFITVLRHILLKVIAAIFPFFKELNIYDFTITIFDQALGMILVPFVVFIAFAPSTVQNLAMYLAIGVIGILYTYRSFRGLTIAAKYIIEHRFHFLLYLCTVEIAPLLILIKLSM